MPTPQFAIYRPTVLAASFGWSVAVASGAALTLVAQVLRFGIRADGSMQRRGGVGVRSPVVRDVVVPA